MKVLVVGAGAYVTGRGTEGLGTVLPALAQYSKRGAISEVIVQATRPANAAVVDEATREINHRLGTRLSVGYRVGDESASDASGFDCAIVVVPDAHHHAMCSRVIESGVHCLVAKPLTPTLAEARDLLALQHRHGVHAMVEFHKRLDPQNRIVKRLIAEDRIGSLSHVNVTYSQRASAPSELFRHWAESANIFQYLGVHYVDLLHFMTGFRPTRVMAVGSKGVLGARGLDVDDVIMAIVVWASPDDPGREFVANFTIGWIDPELSTAESDQRYSISGSKGRIECDQKHRGLEVVANDDRVRSINPHFSEYLADQGDALDFAGYGADSIACFLDDVDAIRGGRTSWQALAAVRPSFQQALVSTAVLEAVAQSLERGSAWIGVDADRPAPSDAEPEEWPRAEAR